MNFIVLLDILSGKNNDFYLKPEIESKSANDRKFMLDDLRVLMAPLRNLTGNNSSTTIFWSIRKSWNQLNAGLALSLFQNIVIATEWWTQGQSGALQGLHQAQSDWTGRLASKTKYYCPHCGYALFLWEKNYVESIYKCQNLKYSHYIERQQNLTRLEAKELHENIFRTTNCIPSIANITFHLIICANIRTDSVLRHCNWMPWKVFRHTQNNGKRYSNRHLHNSKSNFQTTLEKQIHLFSLNKCPVNIKVLGLSMQKSYKQRTEAERYFSRLGPREVEEVSQYKYRAIRNQMTLAHLTLSLTAVAAALVLELPDRIRRYKTFADAA